MIWGTFFLPNLPVCERGGVYSYLGNAHIEPTYFKKGLFSRLCPGAQLSEFKTLLWYILLLSFLSSPNLHGKFIFYVFVCVTSFPVRNLIYFRQRPTWLAPALGRVSHMSDGNNNRLSWSCVWNSLGSSIQWKTINISTSIGIFTLSNQSWQHCNISLRTFKLISRTLARVFCDYLQSYPLGKE